MGWEQRGGKTYYYSKKRDGERVVSEYMGSGQLASIAANTDWILRIERMQKRREIQNEREEFIKLYKKLDAIGKEIDTLVRAFLVAEGYHTHKGQWRRKRG